jgi:lysophospholipase L1-like esterase
MLVFSACSDISGEDEISSALENARAEQFTGCLAKLIDGQNSDIVFFGDSITYFGGFETEFSDVGCVNFGICSDTISNLIQRLPMIHSAKPKKLFLLIGINSLHNSFGNVDKCALEYELLVKELKEMNPDMKLYIQSLLPTSIAHGEYVSNSIIIEFNSRILEISKKYGAEYIDLHSLYKSENGLNISYTSDGLHIEKSAYKIWYDAIRDFVYEENL